MALSKIRDWVRFSTAERYLAREIYQATALVLFALLMLFAFFDLINELGSVGQGGYKIQHAIGFVLLTLPGRCYELLPVAVLIGSLYALTQLARHSEITVLRVSGAATIDFVAALIKIGAVFVLLVFLVGEVIAPPAERAAQQLRLGAMKQLVANEFRSGLWVKDDNAFINAADVTPEAGLLGVRIYQFDPRFQLQSISEAAHGEFSAPDSWRFANVTRTVFEGNRILTEKIPELNWKSSLNPDILSVLMVNPDHMSIYRLWQYIGHLEANQQKTDRYDIALWKKLVYPFACIVMLVLALPFAYLQDRMGNVSIKVFVGIMLGVLFNMLNGLFSSLGILNGWTPFVAAITPSVIFVLLASGMLWWTERR